MMDLTPLEVRKKKGDFRRQLRGYEPGQVDDFLDVVADRLEQLVRENMAMTERLTRLEQQVTEFRDRERAMTDALVTAQEMRDQMRSQVAKEVDLAKRQAVQDAEHIRAEALQEREREEDNLLRLRQRQRQLLQSFRTLLERELSELVVFAKALEFDESMPESDAPRPRRGGGRGRGPARPVAPEPDETDDGDDDAAAGVGGPAAALAGGLAGGVLSDVARPYEPPRAEAMPEPSRPEPRAQEPPPSGEAMAGPAARAPERPEVAEPRVSALAEEPAAAVAEPEQPAAAVAPSGAASARLDPFGEPVEPEEDALDALLREAPARVEDRPEPAAEPRAAAPVRPGSDSLSDVSDDEVGGLFTGWDDQPEPEAPADAPPELVLDEAPANDEEFLDELLLAGEAELVLSDEDVLEEPVDASALEEVGGDADAEFMLDDELLEEPAAPAPAATKGPGDRPVDLGVLPDTDELADLNLDDFGLPPLRPAPDADAFGSAGLTLRPLPDEDVPEERERGRDDNDDDMFTSLFGKSR